jgi:hypothetical protein
MPRGVDFYRSPRVAPRKAYIAEREAAASLSTRWIWL